MNSAQGNIPAQSGVTPENQQVFPETEATVLGMTPTLKPLLLLDIDGAVCPMRYRPSDADDVYWATDTEYVILEMTDWLADLADVFELHWASAWGESAAESLGPALGVGVLPYVVFSRGALLSRGSPSTWKLADVSEYAGTRPMAWVDDELRDDARDWARNRNASVPTLLVSTRADRGLQRVDVETLLEFAARCS
jgi:hypothetical protein